VVPRECRGSNRGEAPVSREDVSLEISQSEMRGAPAARGTAFYWVEGRLRCLLARRSKFSSFSLCPQLHYTPYT